MSLCPRGHGGGSPLGRALSIALLAMALALAPGSARAQFDVTQAEAQHQAALADYDARFIEYRRAFQSYEVALDQVVAARGTAAQEGALARFSTLAVEAMAAEAGAGRAAERLEAARSTLLIVLNGRDAEILAQLESESNPARRAVLTAEWDAVGQRVDELEAAGPRIEEQIALRPVPELTVSPRDTPRDLSFKADFMEERAAQYDAVILWIEGQVAQVEARLLQLQNAAGLLQGLRRYDSDISPGGQLGTDAQAPPDETQGGAGPSIVAGRSLPDQLGIYQDLRAQTIQYRDRARVQAQLFRQLASAGSGL
ncbi:MAG: hypothetical protein EXR92_01305 [Gemmatimonadetes bacterium]|nr:hypothetical protein [Gemmatimonadota bacterium]